MRDRVADALDGFIEMEPWLWWLAIAFFGIGDVMTTGAALVFTPIAEGNPVVAWIFESYGLAGMVPLKLGAFGVTYTAWRTIRHPHNVGIPLALSVLGVGLTTWNLFVLAFVASG